jgi:hypothetical protein
MFIFIAKTQYIVAGCHVTDISVKVGVEGHNPFGAVSFASLSVMGSATTGFLRYIRTILAGLGTRKPGSSAVQVRNRQEPKKLGRC